MHDIIERLDAIGSGPRKLDGKKKKSTKITINNIIMTTTTRMKMAHNNTATNQVSQSKVHVEVTISSSLRD